MNLQPFRGEDQSTTAFILESYLKLRQKQLVTEGKISAFLFFVAGFAFYIRDFFSCVNRSVLYHLFSHILLSLSAFLYLTFSKTTNGRKLLYLGILWHVRSFLLILMFFVSNSIDDCVSFDADFTFVCIVLLTLLGFVSSGLQVRQAIGNALVLFVSYLVLILIAYLTDDLVTLTFGRFLFNILQIGLCFTVGIAFSVFRELSDYKIFNEEHSIKEEEAVARGMITSMFPRKLGVVVASGGRAGAKAYDDVTLIFISVCGWSEMLKTSPTPLETITLFDKLMIHLDLIAENIGVYKVENVEDTWVGIAGFPRPDRCHAGKMVMLALVARDIARAFEMSVRIGIHTGSVVAGIVGATSFQLCIFGDAVNTTARIKGKANSDEILLSKDCFLALAARHSPTLPPFVRLVSRGPVFLKGKGMRDVYCVDYDSTALDPLGFSFPSEASLQEEERMVRKDDAPPNGQKFVSSHHSADAKYRPNPLSPLSAHSPQCSTLSSRADDETVPSPFSPEPQPRA